MTDKDVKRVMADVDIEKCPVIPLGTRDGAFCFISVSGEVLWRQPRDFTASGIMGLFGGHTEWLVQFYPRKDKEGKPLDDFNVKSVTSRLMRDCTDIGVVDPDVAVHGPGTWASKDRTRIILNSGDTVTTFWEGGKSRRVEAGFRDDTGIYPVSAPLAQPDRKAPATHYEMRAVLDRLSLWNFTTPWHRKALLGGVALAVLGAAPRWRVHVALSGKHGAGKSALLALVRALLGPSARMLNDFTEAGVRQMFQREARAMLLDEDLDDGTRCAATVQLLRRMAGEEGVQSVRGSAGGQEQRFAVAGMAFLAAINAPPLQPQDRSRIFEVQLRELVNRDRGALEKAQSYAAEISPKLRGRVLFGWARFGDNLATYLSALSQAGCDQRQSDKFGTLLAAAAMLLSDAPIDRDEAAAEVGEIAPAIEAMIGMDADDSNGGRALMTLMTRQVDHWRGGSKSTIAEMVVDAMNCGPREAARKALGVYGLRLELSGETEGVEPVPATRLFIANQHEGLKSIYRDTPWRDGGWRAALLQLAGVEVAPPKRFSDVQQRCVALPEELLPKPEDEGDAPAV